jgi:hypothetical protein
MCTQSPKDQSSHFSRHAGNKEQKNREVLLKNETNRGSHSDIQKLIVIAEVSIFANMFALSSISLEICNGRKFRIGSKTNILGSRNFIIFYYSACTQQNFLLSSYYLSYCE